jgi:hypothetical protein
MITFSRSYSSALEGLFHRRTTYSSTSSSNGTPEQIAWLQFSTQDSEIPSLYAKYGNPTEKKEYITPLYLAPQEYSYRTSEALIKRFFTSGSNCGYLFKGHLGDRIYYGNRGILLDSNYNLLFLATVEPGTNLLTNFKNIYISPKVFTNLTDLINKHIVQKIIPYFCLYNPSVNIHIKDINHILKRPIFPKSIENINEELNNILINSTDYLIK